MKNILIIILLSSFFFSCSVHYQMYDQAVTMAMDSCGIELKKERGLQEVYFMNIYPYKYFKNNRQESVMLMDESHILREQSAFLEIDTFGNDHFYWHRFLLYTPQTGQSQTLNDDAQVLILSIKGKTDKKTGDEMVSHLYYYVGRLGFHYDLPYQPGRPFKHILVDTHGQIASTGNKKKPYKFKRMFDNTSPGTPDKLVLILQETGDQLKVHALVDRAYLAKNNTYQMYDLGAIFGESFVMVKQEAGTIPTNKKQ